ncbi:MAG: AsmA family protein [Rhodospirillales bacterium]|nr:AsmA family protein [Rhodospirillales bacterium]
MKKFIASSVLSLIVLVIFAVVVGPGLIDWNKHKSTLTDLAKQSTGHDVFIDGDIKLNVFPSPAFIANKVRVANVKGGAVPEMVRLESLEVRIAPAPLLAGHIQIESVKLIRPVVEVQMFADGRHNLAFATASKDASPAPTGSSATPSAQNPTPSSSSAKSFLESVQLDSFAIEDGTVVYRNTKDGTTEKVSAIHGRLAAGSLIGPFESSGRFILRGIPISFEANIGKTIHGRTLPLSATLGDQSGRSKLMVSGTVASLTDKPSFKGKIKGQGKNLAGLIRDLTGNTEPLPGFLGQSYNIEGTVTASESSVEAKKLALKLGESKASADISVNLKKSIRANVKIAAEHVDLDKWLALPTDTGKPALTNPMKNITVGKSAKQQAGSISRGSGKKTAKSKASAKSDPAGINTVINLSVQSVTFKQGLIHKTRLSAEISGGELTINQLSTQLPGAADVAVFGFVANTKTGPKFEGDVDINAGNSRKVARWLGVELPDLPSGRLRRITMKGKVTATSHQVGIRGLNLKFDSSRVTGGVTVALPLEPISFGANLTLDKINLDAYLVKGKPAKRKAAKKVQSSGGAMPSTSQTAPVKSSSGGGTFAALSVLKSFSADVKAYAKNVRYNGKTITGIVLDGRLFDNKLTIRRASVAKAEGASLMIKGEAKGLVGIANLKNVQIDLRAPSVKKLARLLGAKVPPEAARLGKIDLSGKINGSVLKPAVDLTFKGGGATVVSKGTVSFLPLVGGADLDVSLKHGSLKKFLQVLGVQYRPSGKTGAVNLRGHVRSSTGVVDMDNVRGNIGLVKLSGKLGLRKGKARPKITADLVTNALDLNAFAPAKRRRGNLRSTPRVIPAAWVVPRAEDANNLFVQIVRNSSARWSPQPLDLSQLKTVDADIKLQSKSIKFETYRLDKAIIALNLKNGTLQANKLAGVIFGGTLDGQATLKAGAGIPTVASVVKIRNMNVLSAVRAITKQSLASGSLDLDLNLAARGLSPMELVSTLGGKAKVAIRNLDPKKVGKGTAFAGALGLARMMNRTSGLLGGRRGKSKGLADVAGNFVIDKGIARSQDLTVTANAGQGIAKGFANLPKWHMDFNGDLTLSKDPLSTIIRGKSKIPDGVPFRIYGALDKPNVKVDTSKLPGGGLAIPIPGAERLLKSKKVIKGLDVLKKFGVQIPGITQPTPAPAPQGQVSPPPLPPNTGGTSGLLPPPPPPPPAQEPQRKKLRFEDVLKQLQNLR